MMSFSTMSACLSLIVIHNKTFLVLFFYFVTKSWSEGWLELNTFKELKHILDFGSKTQSIHSVQR